MEVLRQTEAGEAATSLPSLKKVNWLGRKSGEYVKGKI